MKWERKIIHGLEERKNKYFRPYIQQIQARLCLWVKPEIKPSSPHPQPRLEFGVHIRGITSPAPSCYAEQTIEEALENSW